MKKRINLITTLLCLLPIVLGVIFYQELPDTMATHFNVKNEPDGFMPKTFALFGLPVIMAVIQGITCFVMDQDERKKGVPKKLEGICKCMVPMICMLAEAVTIMYGLDEAVNVGGIVITGMGMLFVCVGNFLPKCRYNYVVGIRIPTTLNSEQNWNKTHRMAGFVWVICSIGIIILGILQQYILATILLGVMIVLPIFYSIVLAGSNKQKK